jgi:shikimate kinase/3-dehydroquinate synthase
MKDRGPIRRVLLVGFMGSGKTEVGQALARRLGWPFRDFDQEVRFRVGLPIPEIFRQHGEARFREMEAAVGAELLREEKVVLASGGGWPAGPERMEALPPGTLSVWLKVTAEEAVRRVREEGPTRPLLAVPDPVSRARELLGEREPFYRKASLALDSLSGPPDLLAGQVEDFMNTKGRSRSPSASI